MQWTSSNTDVATVNDTGLVTAKASGTATITVKNSDGKKSATCVVDVTDGYLLGRDSGNITKISSEGTTIWSKHIIKENDRFGTSDSLGNVNAIVHYR